MLLCSTCGVYILTALGFILSPLYHSGQIVHSSHCGQSSIIKTRPFNNLHVEFDQYAYCYTCRPRVEEVCQGSGWDAKETRQDVTTP